MISVSPSGQQGGRRGIRTHMTRRSRGLANRPGKPYPATFRSFQWTHPELNWDLRHARAASSPWTMSPCFQVDRRGVEPRLPGCKPSVFPLDQRPEVQEVRPGFEPGLPPYHGGGPPCGRCPPKTPTDHVLQMIPTGIEPTLSCMSRRRRNRWTTGPF